jgi:hypothetical protein
MLAGYEMIRRGLIPCLAALLCGCAALATGDRSQIAADGGTASVAAPAGSFARVTLPVLGLQQNDNAPGPCEATVYGSLAAMRDGTLCVCRQGSDGPPGVWMRADSSAACWRDLR